MADQKDNGEQNVLEYVTLGDLVIFSVVGTSAGTMIGDTALGRVGVQVAARGGAPSLQQHECAFEICPMLSYHAMKELRREMKEVLHTWFEDVMGRGGPKPPTVSASYPLEGSDHALTCSV